MSFWIACNVLLLATLIAIIVPIMRVRAVHSTGYNLATFQNQLFEIERDVNDGLLSVEDGQTLRTEIEKRIQKNAEDLTNKFTDDTIISGEKTQIVTAIVLAMIISFGSYIVYFYLGSSGKPDLPFANRDLSPSIDNANVTMNSLVKRLKERLDKNPNQLKGWILLGQSLVSLKRFYEASNAFKRAIDIAPNRADLAASAAETRFMAKGGKFDQEVRDYFKMAQRLNPEEHKALYFLGLDSYMAKKHASAIQYWVDLISISPVGAPWMDSVRERLLDAAKAGNLKISEFTPRLKATPKGSNELKPERDAAPTQEDIKNAGEMSEEEREIFILSMVEQLANRLKSEPNDLNGWRKLARAYRVLGEKKKAELAEKRVQELEK
ncbi:MAG: c-type cytochrome biogenesis protein CcmI [Pseudomonadota bacterium]|nr:c-type cytochrome biogenesis protein CcmI [Pseudomonadota bacterium]